MHTNGILVSIYFVASLFKFYETLFLYLYFDWIESHARPAKMVKSSTCIGIVLVDAKATRWNFLTVRIWCYPVAGTEVYICQRRVWSPHAFYVKNA